VRQAWRPTVTAVAAVANRDRRQYHNAPYTRTAGLKTTVVLSTHVAGTGARTVVAVPSIASRQGGHWRRDCIVG
jgi:hypothetical protein